MKNYKIVGLGEVLWDVFPDGRRLGGAPANFAYHAHALGAGGHLVSRVGDDDAGREILSRLTGLGIVTGTVGVDPEHPTGTVEVELDAAGKPLYEIRKNAAWDYIRFSEAERKLAAEAHAVCFGTLCSRSPVSRESIRRFLEATPPTCLKIFDINLRQTYYSEDLVRNLLARCNVLKLSDDELPVIAELLGLSASEDARLQQLCRDFNLDLIALTRGSEGSLLFTLEGKSEQPAGEIAGQVNTVGAGDSFTAALAVGLLRKLSLDEINRAAAELAAFVCSRAGATPEIPDDLVRKLT